MMDTIYDLIIIGSGPAGLSAAVYAQRAKLSTLIIEKTGVSGGQILNTSEVDNYLGLPGIGGYDLGIRMREHVDALEGQFVTGSVLSITLDGNEKIIRLEDGNSYRAKAIIIAAGASHRMLNIPGEETFRGQGVSYCATCDGAFFRNQITAVIGGGDVAVEDALFLARLCKQVYVIHRRNEFRAAKVLGERLEALENVTILWDSTAVSINGTDTVESLSVQSVKTNETKDYPVSGVFIAVGMVPNSSAYKGVVDMDASGYIIANETGITSTPGIFAAGDIRTKQLRQVISAAGDGANAVYSVQQYLTHL